MTMSPEQAMEWLKERGYAKQNDLGFVRVTDRPTLRDLAYFVLAVKTLGAWSVGDGRRVEVSCGSRDGELVFKLSKSGQDTGGGKGAGTIAP